MSEQGITGAANNVRVLDLTGVQRTFYQGRNELKVLRGVDLVLRQGEIVALVGPSGSGKSTLLHIAGLLEPPDAGDVAIAGQSCNGMNDLARTTMRREHLGFVCCRNSRRWKMSPSPPSLTGSAAASRKSGPEKSSAGWGWKREKTTARPDSRAASSNGSPSPGHWRRSRACYWPMNRPAIWTRGQHQTYLRCF